MPIAEAVVGIGSLRLLLMAFVINCVDGMISKLYLLYVWGSSTTVYSRLTCPALSFVIVSVILIDLCSSQYLFILLPWRRFYKSKQMLHGIRDISISVAVVSPTSNSVRTARHDHTVSE